MGSIPLVRHASVIQTGLYAILVCSEQIGCSSTTHHRIFKCLDTGL